jgi:hypothetical protein
MVARYQGHEGQSMQALDTASIMPVWILAFTCFGLAAINVAPVRDDYENHQGAWWANGACGGGGDSGGFLNIRVRVRSGYG